MPASSNPVRPKAALSKTRVSSALAAGWGRIVHKVGKGAFADAIELQPRSVDRALIGDTTPELHTALNALIADPSALDEVLALYGYHLTPCRADPANDMALVTSLSDAVADFLHRLADGVRCHRDTSCLATIFRGIVPQMQAIIDEDDERKAA